jgi:thymidylate synthase
MPDTQYEHLLRHVLDTGARKQNRTGTGTRSIFGHQFALTGSPTASR